MVSEDGLHEDRYHLHHQNKTPGGGLVVGNYCHDVLFRGGSPVSQTLGGAASFVSNVLDALSPSPLIYIAKVGDDFAYHVPHLPRVASSPTTLFHAQFPPAPSHGGYHGDRILRRVRACDPISPSDLPDEARFEFGLAVGVAGEILPETLARMLDLCSVVLVDVQGIIRSFDPIDGTVGLVPLRSTGFFHLLPRIGFLKASAEEAPFVDIEEVRKWCCVIVTQGKDGCRIYWKDGEMDVSPFQAEEVDPTGAGDSFLGGFVAGLVWGLTIPDAALLGNFFGSLTVTQVGVPKFNDRMLKHVKEELRRVGQPDVRSSGSSFLSDFGKSDMHRIFHEGLVEAAKLTNANCHTNSVTGKDDDKKLSNNKP
ncbi:inositol 3-kinase-like isoform X1 [Zingiber officinale]|uniref:inositol 3-kinase-like isoform X1 n=1 Tax=Zingiber officinale TaxID=94328 RepID=UPI001C4A84C0|nr:inositol 3-kinase-like isoform X1 [Zingiber officinale]